LKMKAVHPVRADPLNLVRLVHGKDIHVENVAVWTWPLKATLDVLDGLAHRLLDQGGGAGGALMLAGAPVPRLMLHAARLSFPHPEGGTTTIEAPLPPDMAAMLARLGLALPAPA
jgi:tRNA pseudouridine32 synthase/23S rRNA pseudouridine746 synthase